MAFAVSKPLGWSDWLWTDWQPWTFSSTSYRNSDNSNSTQLHYGYSRRKEDDVIGSYFVRPFNNSNLKYWHKQSYIAQFKAVPYQIQSKVIFKNFTTQNNWKYD